MSALLAGLATKDTLQLGLSTAKLVVEAGQALLARGRQESETKMHSSDRRVVFVDDFDLHVQKMIIASGYNALWAN
jgi:hypothetical protein